MLIFTPETDQTQKANSLHKLIFSIYHRKLFTATQISTKKRAQNSGLRFLREIGF